ncbi:hypothetical protein L218DRAFT_954503 [Marasmius fiardii PR-910]|nr:hypothetical protein L218DRAFT_954503 [Marasmius fiardii PR-910]
MNLLFTPNHIQLLNSCYPPTSSLLTSGPEYSPNSQELSRLTYYASNHPDKIAKLGTELEKRLRTECRKAQSGNLRARASLLITLAIFRSLAIECRRDLNLISASLVASIEATLSSISGDLEVSARAASVFTTWTTYTNGHLIGTDNSLTKSYIASLRLFATLSSSEAQDTEIRNRTRLVGFAALTGAINSEALYNDSVSFRTQVSIIMRPVLRILLRMELVTLEQQALGVKDAPISPYLAEFRTRPVIERRAASIHLHIDGENGPSTSEVSSAALRALFSLLGNVNGSQLDRIMRCSFENMEELKAWNHVEHCCWFAQKAAEWSQYQYRFAVPTLLVERLVASQEAGSDEMQKVLTIMITTVFKSSVPLINVSTSDILSNLMSLIVQKVTLNPEDNLLSPLVECISSLGCHVYYSDQILDLAGELITRISSIEMHGVVSHKHPAYASSRAQAIRCLLMGLLGLMHATNKDELDKTLENGKAGDDVMDGIHEHSSLRSRIPPDMWQDTVSLLCDENFGVRADYSEALVYYIVHEMPKHGNDRDPSKQRATLGDQPSEQATFFLNSLLHTADIGGKLLHAIHAYLYILLTSSSLDSQTSTTTSSDSSPHNTLPALNVEPATPLIESHPDLFRSLPPSQDRTPRTRKLSMAFRLIQSSPQGLSGGASACLKDYTNALNVLTTIHQHVPIRAIVTGVPMLLALDGACDLRRDPTNPRICAIKIILATTWLKIGKVWESPELITLAEKALTTWPSSNPLPKLTPAPFGTYHSPQESDQVSSLQVPGIWSDVDAEKAVLLVGSSQKVQRLTGLDQGNLLLRFSRKWTAESALKESVEKLGSFEATLRGDGVSPLIKIAPGLMHIENHSMASLARSTRGVGVTDLREALEGRSSMSNPALARPSSISTLDHTSSILNDIKLTKTRSRTRNKRAIPSGTGEVRDVLNKLGLGKQNGTLLKSSIPLQQRS